MIGSCVAREGARDQSHRHTERGGSPAPALDADDLRAVWSVRTLVVCADQVVPGKIRFHT
jgi:hypothetical protein